MARYGRYATTDPQSGTLQPGSARAYVPDPMTVDGFATSVSGHVGRSTSTTPNGRFGIMDLSSGGNPSTRRGYTESFSPSTLMTSGADGAVYTANIDPDGTRDGAKTQSTNVMMLFAGKSYGISIGCTGAPMTFGIGNANSAADNNYQYLRTGLASSVPPDPFGYQSSSYEGWITAAINYTANTKPSAPTGRTPSGTLMGADFLAPTFEGNFVDAESSVGDRLGGVWIQVRQVGFTALKWNLADDDSTSGERTAARFSRVYDGSTLSAGVQYEWRCKVSDQFGEESFWSTWLTFTPGAEGTVTPSTPSGKVNNTTQNFVAVWDHPSNLNAKAMVVQLLVGDDVVDTSPTLTGLAVTPGNNLTMPWASASFDTLVRGRTYGWRAKAQATDNQWTDYSPIKTFKPNATPNKPTTLSPNAPTTPLTAPPVLSFVGTDPDDPIPPVGGVPSAQVRIKAEPPWFNPSFDAGIEGWTTGANSLVTSTASLETVNMQSGTGALKMQMTASTAAAGDFRVFARNDLRMPCVAGETYSATAWGRSDNANVHPKVGFSWYDAAGTLLSNVTEADYIPTINTWSKRTVTAVAPVNAAFYTMLLAATTSVSNQLGTVIFDTVDGNYGTAYIRSATYNSTTKKWSRTTVYGSNEVQTLTKSGTVTGGTFLVKRPETGATVAIQWNSSAAAAQTQLETIYPLGSVLVTGGPFNTTALTVTFRNLLASMSIAQMIATSSLTGTTPGVVAATTTEGGRDDIAAGYAVYKWDSRLVDAASNGPWSSEASFLLGFGPNVAITSPLDGEVITVNTPTLTWTVSTDQVSYRIAIMYAGTEIVAYDTGLVADTVGRAAQIPAGFLHDGESFEGFISVVSSLGLPGTSDIVSFSVDVPAPAAIEGLVLSDARGRFDGEYPTGIQLAWAISTRPPSEFYAYRVYRRPVDESEPYILLEEIRQQARSEYTDWTPASKVAYRFSVRQVIEVGGDLIESASIQANYTISFPWLVIIDTTDPETNRFVARYWSQRTEAPQGDPEFYPTWNTAAPTAVDDATDYDVINFTVQLLSDNYASAFDVVESFRKLRKATKGKTLLYRDGRKRRIFGKVTQPVFTDVPGRHAVYVAGAGRYNDDYDMSASFIETAYNEGGS